MGFPGVLRIPATHQTLARLANKPVGALQLGSGGAEASAVVVPRNEARSRSRHCERVGNPIADSSRAAAAGLTANPLRSLLTAAARSSNL